MQAVILAAGYGLRLRPFTESSPKGLVPILGKPLLAWTLGRLPKSIDEIIIVTGWLGDKISAAFLKSYNGIPIQYVSQDPINGTGSAIHAAKKFVHGTFLVVNGDDVYSSEDLETLSSQSGWAILARKTTQPVAGALVVNSEGFVTDIASDSSTGPKLQNCGAYLLNETFFNIPLVEIPVRDKVEYSLPHTLVQRQTTTPVRLVEASEWLPIGTPEELAKAEKILYLTIGNML